MFDKMEIYPFHRVSEPIPAKRSRRQSSATAKISLDRFHWFSAGNIIARITPQMLIYNLILGLGSILMARAFVLGELLPFAFAYLVAFGYEQKERAWWLGGCSVIGMATVLNGAAWWSNIFTVLALVGTISFMPIPRHKIWWALPLLAAAVIVLSQGLFMLRGDLVFYNIMVAVFEALIAGVLTFIFMFCQESIKKNITLVQFSFEEMAAFIVLGIGLVMGLNEVYFFNLSLGSILGRIGVLTAAFIWGSGGGTMVGVMTGIIPSIASSVFAQSLGIYAISGMLAGLCRNFGRLGVIIGFLLGNMGLAMFISTTEAAILSMWESMVACIVFFLLPAALKEQVPLEALAETRVLTAASSSRIDQQTKASLQTRIENLAQVFEEISGALGRENGSKPGSDHTYVNYLYDEIGQGFCSTCFRYSLCWDQESYRTTRELLDMFTIAEADGRIDYEDSPAGFRRHCIHDKELINTLNHLFENLRIHDYWAQKVEQSRNLVAHQLKGVSQVIRNLSSEMDLNATVDFALREQLLRESMRRQLDITDCSPVKLSERQIYITVMAKGCANQQGCEAKADRISSLLGYPLKVDEKNCGNLRGQPGCEFSLSRAYSYQVSTGIAQIGKEEECGDSFSIIALNREGRQLIALSDGMGVGKMAAQESRAAVNILENLLSCGFDRELAIKTINSVLLLKSTAERFVTLDMVMIDLYNGEADFIKTGSAPALVKRGRQVEVINSNSLPMGIMDEVEVITEKARLYAHDMVVIISDGVIEASRKQGSDFWLVDFLVSVQEKDPQTMAELIMSSALALCSGKPQDDMTVICAYVGKIVR